MPFNWIRRLFRRKNRRASAFSGAAPTLESQRQHEAVVAAAKNAAAKGLTPRQVVDAASRREKKGEEPWEINLRKRVEELKRKDVKDKEK